MWLRIGTVSAAGPDDGTVPEKHLIKPWVLPSHRHGAGLVLEDLIASHPAPAQCFGAEGDPFQLSSPLLLQQLFIGFPGPRTGDAITDHIAAHQLVLLPQCPQTGPQAGILTGRAGEKHGASLQQIGLNLREGIPQAALHIFGHPHGVPFFRSHGPGMAHLKVFVQHRSINCPTPSKHGVRQGGKRPARGGKGQHPGIFVLGQIKDRL